MLKILAAPTFRAKVSIPVAGGEPEKITVVFKHLTRAKLEAFLQAGTDAGRGYEETLAEVIDSWEGVDAPYTRDALDTLCQQHHGAALALLKAYGEELSQARLGN